MQPRQDDGEPINQALASRLAASAVAALEGRRPLEALPSLARLRLLPGQVGLAEALRAEALMSLGRPEEADGAAAAALEDRPGDALRLELRARAHLACGRRLKALDTAAAAVMAAPADISCLSLFATLLIDERRFDEAIEVLEEAWRRQPEDPPLLLRLGLACMRAGHHDRAEALLEMCERAAPALPGIVAARAQAALARKAFDVAIMRARQGLERFGADAALYSVLAHALESAGRREEAWPAFRAAARLAPDDPYLAHLAAVAEGTATERPQPGYIESVFDGYAASFERSLIELGYRVPGLMLRAMERHRPELADGTVRLGPVLDLGCGTGLVGVALHGMLGDSLTGVDLSTRMLACAAEKRIYTSLLRQDIHMALSETADTFDLITAADVFCYLGRLDAVLRLCADRLRPRGLLMFSVERAAEGAGYTLHRQGRYAHAPDLLTRDLAGAGLTPIEVRDEPLRLDFGRPVEGLLVLARRDG
jgi:predicted TPR repeat methyltransferase